MHLSPATHVFTHPYWVMVLFYGVMLVLALGIRWLSYGRWDVAHDLGLPPWEGIVAAMGFAAVGILSARPLMRFRWACQLAVLLRQFFGRPTVVQAAGLGLLSGLGEEFLFRGALQPLLGIAGSTVLFALLHAHGAWLIFAAVASVALGLIYDYSGNLWPCVLGHAVLNAVNIYRLSRWASDHDY